LRGTSIPGVRATDATAHNVAVIEAQFAALERGVTSRSESGVQLALRGLVAEYERQPDVPAQHLPAENLPCQPEHRLAST
jgi:hypothetical protein